LIARFAGAAALELNVSLAQIGHSPFMDLIYRYDPYQPVEAKSPPTAAAAMEELQRGNERFVEIVTRMQARTQGAPSGDPVIIPVNPISLGIPLELGRAPTQAPFAVVVGCSDARAPVEAIFDLAFNTLFVVRVAGNVLGTECLGSIDFAVRNLKGVRLIVALGHSQCGAVSAAVDAYLQPGGYIDIAFTFSLRTLIDRIQFAVRGASRALYEVHGGSVASRKGYRNALRDLAVYINAAATAHDLRREFLSGIDNTKIEVVSAVYDLATVTVKGQPMDSVDVQDGTSTMFTPAPRSAEEFAKLAVRWAKSDEISAVLDA
jgi:carbonic anhydrase